MTETLVVPKITLFQLSDFFEVCFLLEFETSLKISIRQSLFLKDIFVGGKYNTLRCKDF